MLHSTWPPVLPCPAGGVCHAKLALLMLKVYLKLEVWGLVLPNVPIKSWIIDLHVHRLPDGPSEGV